MRAAAFTMPGQRRRALEAARSGASNSPPARISNALPTCRFRIYQPRAGCARLARNSVRSSNCRRPQRSQWSGSASSVTKHEERRSCRAKTCQIEKNRPLENQRATTRTRAEEATPMLPAKTKKVLERRWLEVAENNDRTRLRRAALGLKKKVAHAQQSSQPDSQSRLH